MQEDERRIYHFHFKAWPDHGVPNDPGCVLNFLHDVNAKHESIEMASPASKKVRIWAKMGLAHAMLTLFILPESDFPIIFFLERFES